VPYCSDYLPQLIYDPNSATGTAARTPFPGNVIPTSRLSEVSQSFASYLPNPTNGNITNNYLAVSPPRRCPILIPTAEA
jgi:hypothetical protein